MRRTALLAALLCSACSSYYNHVFYPAPLEVQQEVQGDSTSQARALVSVVGIRKPDSKAGTGVQFEVRLRIENVGASAVQLVADSLSLVAADLRSFEPPSIEPEPAWIAQGEVAVYDIVFPFPAGTTPKDYDLKGINLGWSVDFGEQRVKTGVTFERAWSGGGEPHVSMGFGYYRTN
jgi:hypothetical protein